MSAPPARTTGTILGLGEINNDDRDLVGGKAANLGVLIAAGLPVPPGVCVTTEAYRQVAGTARLDPIHEALTDPATTDTAALCAQAREALLAAPIPDDIAAQILAGYARLGQAVPVAVRSSATAEDLPFASFAGQQDTYLNVVGEAAVIDAVRRCWASLWTHRAVTYRTVNGIDHRRVRLAVVIQRMVDAAVSGVLFTANPVTGHRRQAVINASPGLGEAVVSGVVTPDQFVVDTPRRAILDRRVGDKRFTVRAVTGGGTARGPGSEGLCLTDGQVLALAELGDRVETLFGTPQDIEWAIDEQGVPWLTQSRPVTTLHPLPAGAPADGTRVYFCASVAQGLYRPITPMGMSAFRLIGSGISGVFGFPVADPLAGPPVVHAAGHRMFFDVTPAVRSRTGQLLIPRLLGVMEAQSGAILTHLFRDPRFSVTQRSHLPFARRVAGMAARHKVPLWLGHALVRPQVARARVERIADELDRRLTVPEDAAPARRLDIAERFLTVELPPLPPRILPVAAAGFIALGLARLLLGHRVRPGELHDVLRGVPHNVTTVMDLELWRLANRLRDDEASTRVVREHTPDTLARRYRQGALPAVAQAGMAEFLRRYGHRAVAEIDVGMPRWADDPGHLWGALANYLRLDPDSPQSPDRVFSQGAVTAQATVEILAGRCGRVRGWLVRRLLHRCRQLVGVRELPKSCMVKVIAAARQQVARVGVELARQGSVAAADDVFFLDLAEARAALSGMDMRERVEQRRAEYHRELRRRHVPRVLLSDGTEPQPPSRPDETDGSMVGTAASAGTVTGTARVILDPIGARLEPGDILVAPSTDPGWTPLFLTAGGLVMEMGGANSHGAVVAREYGIPAVVGLPGATSRIPTGQRITVDGTSGVVRIG